MNNPDLQRARIRGQVEELIGIAPDDPDMAYGLGCFGAVGLAFTGCAFLPDESSFWLKLLGFVGFLVLAFLMAFGVAELWLSTKRRKILSRFKRHFRHDNGTREIALEEFAVLLKRPGRENAHQEFLEKIYQRLGGILEAGSTNVHQVLDGPALDDIKHNQHPVDTYIPPQPETQKKPKKPKAKPQPDLDYIPLDIIKSPQGSSPGTLRCSCGSEITFQSGTKSAIECLECGTRHIPPEG